MIHQGDCREVLATFDEASVDAVVTDPPYELGFMGKGWDRSGIAYDVDLWRAVLRVLKPGAHLLAFGGARTHHRMVCAIEDAGFEIRDEIQWLYGSGFPKSLDVSKAIDKAAGAERVVGPVDPARAGRLVNQRGDYSTEAGWSAGGRKVTIDPPATNAARQWEGWGTALKPAAEPICLARKPLTGTVAANVLEHGTGALNIDGCRIATEDSLGGGAEKRVAIEGKGEGWQRPWMRDDAAVGAHTSRVRANVERAETLGRWPANVILDPEAAALLDEQSGELTSGSVSPGTPRNARSTFSAQASANELTGFGDSGGASRFFYCAKPAASERHQGGQNTHATVKPLKLMRYLVRLVTPPGGTVLDPFAGSGTTIIAAMQEGFNPIGIELNLEYIEIAERRIAHVPTALAKQLSLLDEYGL